MENQLNGPKQTISCINLFQTFSVSLFDKKLAFDIKQSERKNVSATRP